MLEIYHSKIKFAIELNAKKLLDVKSVCKSSICNTIADRKLTKLPIPWLSKAPKVYKHVIIGICSDQKEYR